MRRLLLMSVMLCLAEACLAENFDIRVPDSAVAGNSATISIAGSGKGTFYLLGPGTFHKNEVELGHEIKLQSQDLQNAGAYLAVVCSDECRSATFYVRAAKPGGLSFLVHPSRVPVKQDDAVTGVALAFDQFHNLALSPVTIDFKLTAGNTSLFSRSVRTRDGVAWFRTTSGQSAGSLQVVAVLDDLSARRVVQQVASEPCNLRIKGQRTSTGILVETEPVHDCAGNSLPDGTIVTFTAADANGKNTVDAPIKQGVARAQMTASNTAVISVASGVVMGNELRIGAQP
jgi:hypothetical protein